MSRMLKAKGAVLKHKGVMADLSTKLELFIEEINDEQAIELNKFAKSREVDVIIVPSGELDNIENLINDLRNTRVFESEEEFINEESDNQNDDEEFI